MLPLYRVLSVFVCLLFIGSTIQAQTCQPAPLGSDDCAGAPLMSCNLDGYIGTTAGYTPGPPPDPFCGLVENDQYFRFEVDEVPVAINIVPGNCTTGKGLQASLYLTDDCNTFSQVSLCASFGSAMPLNVISTSVSVGDVLYLMIDGFEGDICDFTINVVQGILPDVEAEAEDAELCLGNQIQLDGTASTQRSNVEYFWEATNGGNIVSGENTMTPTVDALGEYTLTVVDVVDCCIDQTTVTVSENLNAPTFNFESTYTITCAEPFVTLNPDLANPTDFTYLWSTTDGTISASSLLSNSTIDVEAAGTYTLEIEDTTTGCTYIRDVVVGTSTSAPDISAISTNNLDCFNTSTTITGNSSQSNLMYSWQGPGGFTSTDQFFEANQEGNYAVTVTATNGCTATADVDVSISGNPDGSITKDNDLDCLDEDTQLTASSTTAGATFSWTGPSGPIGGGAQITATEGGTYTLVVTSPIGCSTTVTELVMEDTQSPDVDATVTNEIDCTTTNATLQGSSATTGATFSWTGPNGFSSTDIEPVITEGGMYTLEVTGPNGCTAEFPISVIQNAIAPTAEAGNPFMLDCNLPTSTIGGGSTSTGSEFAYEWTSTTTTGVLGTDPTLPVSGMGTYTLVVTNTNNNCTNTSSVEITEDFVEPTVDAGTNTMLTCSMREVTLGGPTTSTGSEFTHTWTDDAGDVMSNDPTFTTTLIGEYTLTIQNTINGCSNSEVVNVTEDPYTPEAIVASPADLTCVSTTTTLSSSGSTSGADITYEWFDTNNTLISTNAEVDVTEPGNYTLVVTDAAFQCSDSQLVRVEETVMPPLGNAGVDRNIDCVNSDATLEASVPGDRSDFSFEWFDQAGNSVSTAFDFTTDVPGQYDLIITDIVTGCTRESFATVIDNSVYPDADSGMPATITCAATQVQIGGAGSTTGNEIIHTWFDASGDIVGNQPVIDVNSGGEYRLVVTNVSSSCTAEAVVTVDVDQNLPTPNTGTANVLTCAEPSTMLNANQSTTLSGLIAYEWFDPNGTSISNTEAANAEITGDYELIITDTQNGCTNTATIFVAEDKVAPVVVVTNPEIINCYNNFVEVNYTSESGPITPTWVDEMGTVLSTEESYLATEIGVVVLQAVSQTNGCTSTASIDIIEDKVAPEAIIATPDLLTCVTEETTLVPTITNFDTDANYQWSDNTGQMLGNEFDLTVADDGIYTVEIQSVENGCTAEFFVEVFQDIEQPVAVISNTENRIDCFQPAIDVDALMSTSSSPLEYVWTNDNQELISSDDTFSLTQGGEITLLVRNTVNGCTDETSISVVQDQEIPVIDFSPLDKLTCTENTVDVASVISAGHNSFSYTWTGPSAGNIVAGDNTPTVTVDSIGTYTLEVQSLLNGCTATSNIQVEEDRVLPELIIQPTEELNCVTEFVTIDASNSSVGAEFQYDWTGVSISSGLNTPAIEVDSSGQYGLTITNTTTGCTNTMLIDVAENTEKPVGASLFMAEPSCYGERDGVLDIENVIGGTAPYIYAINSENNFTDINTYNNLPSGEYTLIVKDNIGCEWDTLFQIADPEQVTADLGEDKVIRLGEESDLFVQTTGDVVSIIWTDNGEVGPIDVDFREIQPVRTTTYVVVVTNEAGCMGTDNVVVQVEDDTRVYAPNAFSPNGDGINDYFTLFTDIAAVEISSLQIYDRWGNQVFEKNNFSPNIPEQGWDGIWRGKNMQPDTYVYSAFIEFQNGNKINFKGEINIVY